VLVAAVIMYPASDPEQRRVEPAVVGEAVRARYGPDPPGEIARWLARRTGPSAHDRRHGAQACDGTCIPDRRRPTFVNDVAA